MENLQRNRKKDKLSSLIVGLSTVFFGLYCLSGPGLVLAAVEQKSEPAVTEGTTSPDSKEGLGELLQTYFTYQRENRSDPFATFIKKETPKATIAGQEAEEEEVLSGMQLFEPGQLSLVSIVFTEDKAVAMVQDSAGKGYIIERGTKIGRTGVVEDIIPNVVIIKQWSMTFANQKKYKNIEMVLRKEGE